jgi:hypothetical protein
LGKAEMRYVALEDIFILKLIANRERDIENCEALAPSGLDYDAVYSEVEASTARPEHLKRRSGSLA